MEREGHKKAGRCWERNPLRTKKDRASPYPPVLKSTSSFGPGPEKRGFGGINGIRLRRLRKERGGSAFIGRKTCRAQASEGRPLKKDVQEADGHGGGVSMAVCVYEGGKELWKRKGTFSPTNRSSLGWRETTRRFSTNMPYKKDVGKERERNMSRMPDVPPVGGGGKISSYLLRREPLTGKRILSVRPWGFFKWAARKNRRREEGKARAFLSQGRGG